jgi:integrase/recombinase XerD
MVQWCYWNIFWINYYIVDLQTYISDFEKYLLFERVYSVHTVKAYISNTQLLNKFLIRKPEISKLEEISSTLLERFLVYLKRKKINASSQARHLTGLRSFFNFLMGAKLISRNPVKYLESPKITSSSLPKSLTTEEIDLMLNLLFQSNVQQRRARAMISLIY